MQILRSDNYHSIFLNRNGFISEIICKERTIVFSRPKFASDHLMQIIFEKLRACGVRKAVLKEIKVRLFRMKGTIKILCLFQAEIRTDFNYLFKIMSAHDEFRWMRLRINRMASAWIEAIKSLAEKQNLENKRKKVRSPISPEVLYVVILNCSQFA